MPTDIGSAEMRILADIRRLKIADRDKKELVKTFATIPHYPEAPGAPHKLLATGSHLFTITHDLAEVTHYAAFVTVAMEHHIAARVALESCKKEINALSFGRTWWRLG
jgi:hypothetical protein